MSHYSLSYLHGPTFYERGVCSNVCLHREEQERSQEQRRPNPAAHWPIQTWPAEDSDERQTQKLPMG